VKALVAPGQAHSGLVAGKLQGVLRSRTFTLDQKKIHFRVAGRQGLINVVIDGYHLIRDPIYGSLAMKIDHGEALQWRTLDVSMWLGHRAYVEVVDDGPGYVAVEQIVFSEGGPPAAEGPGFLPGPTARDADLAESTKHLRMYSQIEAGLPAQ